jgi:hypothetical protein
MLAEFFADPYYPDVYIEVDFMEKNPNKLFDFEHIVYEESQQMIIEKLSRYGMSVYFDDGWPDGHVNGGGEYREFFDTLDEIVGGHMARWYKHNFADERKGVFRYFQMTYNAGSITPSEFNTYDHVLMDNSPEKVLKNRLAFTPKRQRFVMSRGTLHELGHTLGLTVDDHRGIDNKVSGVAFTYEWWKFKNYKSSLNYYYVYEIFDYSDGTNGKGDFNDWENLDFGLFKNTHFKFPENVNCNLS